jgi:hypothetical protein
MRPNLIDGKPPFRQSGKPNIQPERAQVRQSFQKAFDANARANRIPDYAA